MSSEAGIVAALEELGAVRAEIAAAVDVILSASEEGLLLLTAGDQASQVLQTSFCAILEATSFQDITGQRLTRIEALLQGAAPAREGLENGPALPGAGLRQAATDTLLSQVDD
ncbi:MAG: hypothetical protein NW200_11410 [Hyphomonadaceae bacterium]|nr:hypothetical protein [Hyphomonadaceae bacterium]